MKKVIIDYKERTAQAVLSITTTVSSKLYTVAIFNNAPVKKEDLDAQAVIVSDAITAAATNDREKLSDLRTEKAILAGMLRENAEFVNMIVKDGNESKLLSSGFEISKTPEKNQLPSAIAKIDAVFTNLPGMINVSWRRSKHARSYRVFVSADNGQTWTLLETVFGRKLLVEQLDSGKRYQFKVVPVGLHGVGPESDIASQLAA